MVLDNFVVNSAVTYSSLTHKSGLTDLTIAHQAQEWCTSIFPVFRDLEEYKDFLNYRGERAQTTIDYLQDSLDDGVTVVAALSRSVRKSELFSTRFMSCLVSLLPMGPSPLLLYFLTSRSLSISSTLTVPSSNDHVTLRQVL
ncbi:hypothetical protein H2248_007255 [Termitomyces sp. 'cryptogamus']|nr:hypothetical protein H2248_007255 [Termitomyces sp. 'cryptogamus']